MGLLEKDALLCERINVRRLRLGMPTKAANPVVQIVDGDEQDVRPACSLSQGSVGKHEQ